MKSSSQSRRGLGRVVAAVLLAAVMAVGVLATAARPALAAGEATMGHLASGANNGNNHFADSGSEAFVLSGDATTAGTVGADFVLASDPAGSRLRFVGRYVDANNWFFVGYDAGSSWILQYKLDGHEAWPTLNGLPTLSQGERANIKVSANGDNVTVNVNGSIATVNCPQVAQLLRTSGKVGFGAGSFNGNTGLQTTDVYFTNVALDKTVVTDFSSWKPFQQVDGQTWEPAAKAPALPEGRKWIQIVAGQNNTGGHNYGDATHAGPITLVDRTHATKAGDTLHLTLVPTSATYNFGVFYSYVDANNWFYIGYDSQSKWYWQCGPSAYGSLGGDLPAPTQGEPLDISINVQNEKLTVTVDDKSVSVSKQNVGDFVSANSGKGHPAVMTKLNNTSVKFADATLSNTADGTTALMEDNWNWAADRAGQVKKVTYVNLADVSGTVRDEKGNALPGATVRIGKLSAKADDHGAYVLKDVEVGQHDIVASAPGYQAQTKQGYDVKGEKDGGNANVDFKLEPKPELDLARFSTISSDQMTVYVGKQFPQVARYVLAGRDAKSDFLRGQEADVNTLTINGTQVTPTVKATISGDTATYVMDVKDAAAKLDLTLTVELKVEGTNLSWRVTDIQKHDGCAPVMTIDASNAALVSVDAADEAANAAFADRSTDVAVSGDHHLTFEDGFEPNVRRGYLYGIMGNSIYSAGVFSNSEAEGDKRVTAFNGPDTMSMTSSQWYYEHGDKNAQKYAANHSDVTLPTSELPWVKVAVTSDANEDGTVDWCDGAVATRSILNVPQGSEAIKDLVNYRIVMNFGSEVSNPYALTADNVKKVSLITDGLPQALLLKGYGNEGHDSANSEYADISSKEGGVEGFQQLIDVAHRYNTEVGIHINAQEAYPESKSFNERMVAGLGDGWGWLDQSYVIDKLWDLGSNARWNRLVQLYDRINGTNFESRRWDNGEYVGDPAVTGATAPGLDALRADAANRGANMDFIYLDVWYQDAWETRRVAEQINALGWRFSTEFPYEGEYDSTWSHWATDVNYGGTGTKGLNSEIIRFLRNDQRDISPNNAGPTSTHQKTAMNNPLLGGYVLEGFEGWANDLDFNGYVRNTYLENLPTRFLQHYQVTDWEDYSGKDGDVAPTNGGNQEKQIKLQSADGQHDVVVTRHEQQRQDSVIEREIVLDGKKVLDDDAYLLPWTQDGAEKLYHFCLDGGSTTWDLLPGWTNTDVVVYKLTDQGRVDGKRVHTGSQLTLDAEAGVPYVIVRASDDAAVPTADDVDFGEGTGVVDPGFNSYAAGDSLDAQTWSGDVDSDAVRVERAGTGDQRLAITSPAQDVAVSTTLTGLVPGKEYVAELYVQNDSDAPAYVKVDSGDQHASRRVSKSVSKNYTASDEKHTDNGLQVSYMTRVYVGFTAGSDTATLTLKRAAGDGATYFDNVRYVQKDGFPVQAADGSFSQDFENAVSGLYPFVVGPAYQGGDARLHLSEKHAPFSQTGWHGHEVDDAIEGNWSLKHHDTRKGLIFQSTPQTLAFEPGKSYTVEFDYQTGSAANTYQVVVGDGENNYQSVKTLDVTYSGGAQHTAHATVEVTGADSGLTWVGLYSGGNAGSTSTGSCDVVIDNLKVTPAADEQAPAAPSDVTADAVTSDSATITWTPSADGDVVAYEVVVDGKTYRVDADEHSLALSGLAADTDHEVSVTAIDGAGNRSDAATGTFHTLPGTTGNGGTTPEGNGNGNGNGNGGTTPEGNGNGGTGANGTHGNDGSKLPMSGDVLNGGMSAGVIVAIVAAVALLAGVAVLWARNRKGSDE